MYLARDLTIKTLFFSPVKIYCSLYCINKLYKTEKKNEIGYGMKEEKNLWNIEFIQQTFNLKQIDFFCCFFFVVAVAVAVGYTYLILTEEWRKNLNLNIFFTPRSIEICYFVFNGMAVVPHTRHVRGFFFVCVVCLFLKLIRFCCWYTDTQKYKYETIVSGFPFGIG